MDALSNYGPDWTGPDRTGPDLSGPGCRRNPHDPLSGSVSGTALFTAAAGRVRAARKARVR